MFDMMRRKSHSRMAQMELRQSLEHFLSAASHAAKGTGATVGPRMTAARDRVQPAAGKMRDAASTGWGSTVAAVAPLAAAAAKSKRDADKATRKTKQKNAKAMEKRAKAMNKRQEKNKKGSKLGTLLFAGAAVGAVGALVLRRRKQGWDEYDPAASTATDPAATAKPMDADEMLPASLAPEATDTTATMTDTAPDVTADSKDQTASPMHSPTVARMAGGASPNA